MRITHLSPYRLHTPWRTRPLTFTSDVILFDAVGLLESTALCEHSKCQKIPLGIEKPNRATLLDNRKNTMTVSGQAEILTLAWHHWFWVSVTNDFLQKWWKQRQGCRVIKIPNEWEQKANAPCAANLAELSLRLALKCWHYLTAPTLKNLETKPWISTQDKLKLNPPVNVHSTKASPLFGLPNSFPLLHKFRNEWKGSMALV